MTGEKPKRWMEIYIADIRIFEEKPLFCEKMGLLPGERRARIERYRNAADKRRGLGAGLLLEYGLRKRGYSLLEGVPGMTVVTTAQGVHGKPYIPGCDGLWFNLSHGGAYVAAVFADCEAGIDIEPFRRVNRALARRCFTGEERACLAECGTVPGADCGNGTEEAGGNQASAGTAGACVSEADRAFTWMWTRKESYIKAVGEGMHLPLDGFSVLEDRIPGEAGYYLHTWELPEGYMLSVCAPRQVEAEVIPVSLCTAVV